MSMMSQTNTHSGIAQGASGIWETLGTRFAQYRVYRRTRSELQMLSNRELKDLGIGRSMINAIAHEAAYGRK